MAAALASDNGLPQLSMKGQSLTGDPHLAHRIKGGKEAIPELLERALIEKGWEEHDPKQQGPDGWNVTWQNQRFGQSEHLACKPWQRLNHLPGNLEITRKDGLVRAMRRLQSQDRTRSKISHFVPESLILPQEYTKLVDEVQKRRQNARQPGDDVWIYKPANQSRGRGISLFREAGQWRGGVGVAVVQHYIRPLLLNDHKFDLRLYVAVVSFKPLVAYIYQDFLVRFATEKYNLVDLKNIYSHLTNTSINTQGPGYWESKGFIGTGCKWSMPQLCIRLHQHGIDDRLLWQRVTDIIILTLLSQEIKNPGTRMGTSSQHCVELLGFDVLIDEKQQPWLLEVNESPSLANDCPVDEQVKIPMLSDFIDLMKLKDSDRIPQRLPSGHTDQRLPHRRLTLWSRPSTTRQRVRLQQAVPRPLTRGHTRSRLTPITNLPVFEEQSPLTAHGRAQTARARPATSSGHKSAHQEQAPTRSACRTPEPHDLLVGNFVLIFPFNRATRRTESISFVLNELQRKEEELRASISGSPFDWSNRPRSYPFAMHQEAEWPIIWPGMQKPIC